MQHYYHLNITPSIAVFPKTFACLKRAGGLPLSEEELDFFKASMDVVGSQLLMALKCNAFRHKASRLQLALSVPATLLGDTTGAECSPRQRIELLLQRVCKVVGCPNARLALYNPNWEEMQVVAGWPSLAPDDIFSFPEPKDPGVVVKPSPTLKKEGASGAAVTRQAHFDLRASIVSQGRIIGVVELLEFVDAPQSDVVRFVETGITKWITFLIEKLAMERVISEVHDMKASKSEKASSPAEKSPPSVDGLRWDMAGVLNTEYGQNELLNQQRMFVSRVIEMFEVEEFGEKK
jgi:hypothetical protein